MGHVSTSDELYGKTVNGSGNCNALSRSIKSDKVVLSLTVEKSNFILAYF